jgi:hypothetical protein
VSPVGDKKTIINIYRELMRIPDSCERNNILKAVSNLYALTNLNQVIPPIAEIMSIIQHDKPTLYYSIKQYLSKNAQFSMVFGNESSYDLCKKKLHDFFA